MLTVDAARQLINFARTEIISAGDTDY